ncbi:MAG TPA: hypothetical protein VJ955_07820 [Desulfuromonadales bacterium]|nr:hypothetical protein [Desulfuromonadales bacterium]
MGLKDKLANYRQESNARIPAETKALMKQATDELAASGILQTVLKPGDRIPEFKLENHKGRPVSTDQLLRNAPLIVNFYRGFW